MQNSNAQSWHDLRLCPRLDRCPRPHPPACPIEGGGMRKIFREKITGTTADQPQLKKLMAALAHGEFVIIPAVDRLSRDTTDLLVIARDMQHAGRACVQLPSRLSIPRPILPSLSLPCLASPLSSNAAASPSAQRAAEPTPKPRRLTRRASCAMFCWHLPSLAGRGRRGARPHSGARHRCLPRR
jgi:Resolvase, N terminal domain